MRGIEDRNALCLLDVGDRTYRYVHKGLLLLVAQGDLGEFPLCERQELDGPLVIFDGSLAIFPSCSMVCAG